MKRTKLLEDLKQYWIQNNIPNITWENANFLCSLIRTQKVKSMLEIWTANWFSAICFWIELEKNNWKLTSIEFSENSFKQALENIKKANLEKTVTLFNDNALDLIPKLKKKYDFVFIDGMKRRTKDFLELVWNKVNNSGIIIIDDVIKFKEKMIGLYELLEEKDISYEIIPIDGNDGIMLVKK